MKIVTVVGARPQFIKASAVSRAIQIFNKQSVEKVEEVILHTGQHYDDRMSAVFFEQLEIPQPKYNLGITEKTHGAMTGKMLEQIEKVLFEEHPDIVLVYGDTNSTLAASIAAAKCHIPVAHVEAGLRSFNKLMPEEINRILTDHASTFLFCPTNTAVKNLCDEGIVERVHNVGDVMYDVTLAYRQKAEKLYHLDAWDVKEQEYGLCTIHRAENTDNRGRLESIFSALAEMSQDMPVVLPLHPRTRKMLHEFGMTDLLNSLQVINPVSYLEMIRLEMSAKVIVTDSGGVQKEAFFHKVPCLTLREETEWTETVERGCNFLCGADKEKIAIKWKKVLSADDPFSKMEKQEGPYGDGTAADMIIRLLTTSEINQ